jgi:HD domain
LCRLPTSQPTDIGPSFVDRLPLTREALGFASERHGGQVRDGDNAPFVVHPLEVGSILTLAGYADHVVAAGVLHDVLEDTDTDEAELAERFEPRVSELVHAVTEDPTIRDEGDRKRALRSKVDRAPEDAKAVFAADKVSKVRELRLRLSGGLGGDEAAQKLRHYRASLAMLEPWLGRDHLIIEQLRFEIEALEALPPG